MGEHALVLITCGGRDEAGVVAHRLVEDHLAAGVQIIPIESLYWWQGEVVEDQEWLLIAKTRAERYEAIETVVAELHSYDVPPLLMVGMDAARRDYLGWIDENATPA